MPTFPLDLNDYFGHWDAYIVYLVIGFAFGFVLEIAGFGNSKKLAAQFYFKDMTVLKVMFTAIIVAMSLIFLTSAVGLLSFERVWVNPTYLWPGIVGGLLMGVGFIVGGFCPGTSLVAAATLKLDGLFFALGAFFGIFLFGETVEQFEDFWTSSYYGRYTLMDWLGAEAGVLVVIIVLAALAVFWGAEQLERLIGKQDLSRAPRWRYSAAGGLVVIAGAALVIGQPERTYEISEARAEQLANRQVMVHPAELLKATHNNFMNLVMIDVRSRDDFDRFHLAGVQHIAMKDVVRKVEFLRQEPANTVFVVMSNDETAATEAWRRMVSLGMINVFILDGGINHWLDVFADESFRAAHPLLDAGNDRLRHSFEADLGANSAVAAPNPADFADLTYEKKITLEKPSSEPSEPSSGGGCG